MGGSVCWKSLLRHYEIDWRHFPYQFQDLLFVNCSLVHILEYCRLLTFHGFSYVCATYLGFEIVQSAFITWSNVDLSSVNSSGIRLRAVLQEIPQQSVTQCSLEFTHLRLYSNLPGVNEWVGIRDTYGYVTCSIKVTSHGGHDVSNHPQSRWYSVTHMTSVPRLHAYAAGNEALGCSAECNRVNTNISESKSLITCLIVDKSNGKNAYWEHKGFY